MDHWLAAQVGAEILLEELDPALWLGIDIWLGAWDEEVPA